MFDAAEREMIDKAAALMAAGSVEEVVVEEEDVETEEDDDELGHELDLELDDFEFTGSIQTAIEYVNMRLASFNSTRFRHSLYGINTMSLGASCNALELLPFDTDFIVEHDSNPENVLKNINTGSGMQFSETKDHKMRNTIIYKCDVENGTKTEVKALKMYRNARAQFTGIKTDEQLQDITKAYQAAVNGAFYMESGEVTFDPPYIQMINSYIRLDILINVKSLFKIAENMQFPVKSGNGTVGMKMPGGTIRVFTTGYILALGGKDFSKVADSLLHVLNIIEDHYDQVRIDPTVFKKMQDENKQKQKEQKKRKRTVEKTCKHL